MSFRAGTSGPASIAPSRGRFFKRSRVGTGSSILPRAARSPWSLVYGIWLGGILTLGSYIKYSTQGILKAIDALRQSNERSW